MKDYFKTFFKEMGAEVGDDYITELESHFEKKEYKKGDLFIDFEDTSKKLAFVYKGLARFYLNTFEGQEFNLTFKKENELFMSFYTIMTDKPSPFAIEFLEDSVIYVADYPKLRPMLDKDTYWTQVLRKLYAHNFILKAEREIQFLMYDAKTRYLNLKESNPELLARLPQYHLALYLGINPVSLNRIIKSLK